MGGQSIISNKSNKVSPIKGDFVEDLIDTEAGRYSTASTNATVASHRYNSSNSEKSEKHKDDC